MYYVTVERFRPYVEQLEYEFDNYQDAKCFSESTNTLSGVLQVTICDEAGKVIDVYQ